MYKKYDGGIYRMWINQPSTLQRYHKYHGINVLAEVSDEDRLWQIWFTNGDEISMVIDKLALSDGWKK